MNVRRRTPLRKANHDYTRGSYLITVVCNDRRHVLGSVDNSLWVPGPVGLVLDASWETVLAREAATEVLAFQVMPNHFHAVLTLRSNPRPLNDIVRHVKAEATSVARRIGLWPNIPLWQRSFHDERLHGHADIRRAIEYVRNNPRDWAADALQR